MPSRRPLATILGIALGLIGTVARGDILVNFDDLGFAHPFDPAQGAAPGSGSYDNGYNLGGGFTSHGAFFNNSYNSTFHFWGGWSYSNVNDPPPVPASLPATSPVPALTDYLHQYAAAPGSAPGGSGIYAIATAGDFAGDTGAAYINLPAGSIPKSFDVTNATYTYLSLVYGDGFTKPIAPGDYLELRIVGFAGLGATGAQVGEIDVPLADYRGLAETILTTWQNVDLSSLAGSRSLGFEVFGNPATQYSTFGGTSFLNQPSYFAMDNLLLGTATVPEPSSLALAGFGLTGLILARLRIRRGR